MQDLSVSMHHSEQIEYLNPEQNGNDFEGNIFKILIEYFFTLIQISMWLFPEGQYFLTMSSLVLLTHCNLMTPYDNTDLGQHRLR